jgi:hypothetical protein
MCDIAVRDRRTHQPVWPPPSASTTKPPRRIPEAEVAARDDGYLSPWARQRALDWWFRDHQGDQPDAQ